MEPTKPSNAPTATSWLRKLYTILLSSAKSTTSVGMLIAGALVFNYVVTIENVPLSVQRFITGYQLTPIGYLLLVNGMLLVLGCRRLSVKRPRSFLSQ